MAEFIEVIVSWAVIGLIIFFFIASKLGLSTKKTSFKDMDVRDTDNQLKFIKAVELQPQKLMNYSEARLFYTIEEFLKNKPERVLSQVNLGEFIRVKQPKGKRRTKQSWLQNKKATESFNSKRVDLLVIDSGGYPKIAIEFQGEGHNQGNSKGRDAVKKICYEKANVHYVEVFPSFIKGEYEDALQQQIRRLLLEKTFHHIQLS